MNKSEVAIVAFNICAVIFNTYVILTKDISVKDIYDSFKGH